MQVANTIAKIIDLLFFLRTIAKIKPIIVDGCKTAPNIRPKVYAPMI